MVAFAQGCHGIGHGTGSIDMVVLQHKHFGQVSSVVAAPAAENGIFIRIAQSRESLARIEQANAGSLQLFDISGRKVCDTGEMTQKVQNDPFRPEYVPCRAGYLGYDMSGFHDLAFGGEAFP